MGIARPFHLQIGAATPIGEELPSSVGSPGRSETDPRSPAAPSVERTAGFYEKATTLKDDRPESVHLVLRRKRPGFRLSCDRRMRTAPIHDRRFRHSPFASLPPVL